MNDKSYIKPLLLDGEEVLCFLEPFMEEIVVTDRRLLFTRKEKGNEYGVVAVPLKNIQAVEASSPNRHLKSFVRVKFGGDWYTFDFVTKDAPMNMYAALSAALGW